jgi:hypothetical protein
MARPLASVSLDTDNLWSYMKTHGDAGWEARPTYLPLFLPIAVDALARLDLRITFFLVGADCVRDENRASLASLVPAGHEVGNHSFEHEPWLHLYTPDALAREIETAESAIQAATGQLPLGFRGPGFSWCPELLRVLARRGYLYDASTFPTFIGPLARAYYFWTAKLSKDEREQRKELFGHWREGFRPIDPYRWNLGNNLSLLEIPVTTMPLTRAPFHLSYLLYLSRISPAVARAYLRTALLLCRATGTEPSFLLHPLDLLGGDEVPALQFFPGMDINGATKRRLFHEALTLLGEYFELVPMSTHAKALAARHRLPLRLPDLALPDAGGLRTA